MSSSLPSSTVTKASTAIPPLLRILLLYLEPLFAFSGALLVLFNPGHYVSTMSRAAVTSTSLDPRTTFIYTELAGGWLHFAFTEAVVLRCVDDVRVWRLLCAGMLLSDLAYCHSCAQAIGGWGVWVDVARWTTDEWVAAVTTWPFVLARCAIVSGLALRRGSGGSVKGAKQ